MHQIQYVRFKPEQILLHTKYVFINTRRYSPLRGLTSSSCGGLRPTAEAFFALWAKKGLCMLFSLILGHFWCSVATSVTLSSNLRNFEKKSPLNQYSKPLEFKVLFEKFAKERPAN